jgi:hypothetical protein
MKSLHKSLALGCILVCFPLGVLAQPQAPTGATKAQSVPKPPKAAPIAKGEAMPRRTNCIFVCGENCRVSHAPNTARWALRACESDCVKKNKC